LSQTAFELWKPKENSGRQQLSGAPHATYAKSVDKRVRRALGCTPTFERINTDYDPGSVVSTAQSNNADDVQYVWLMFTHADDALSRFSDSADNIASWTTGQGQTDSS